jgi:hypothetical protein
VTNKYDIRADFSPTEKTKYFGRYSRQTDTRNSPGVLPPQEAGTYTDDHYTQIVLGASHVFRDDLFGEIGTSFSRALAVQQGGLAEYDPTEVGYPSSFTSLISKQLPYFNTSDVTSLQMKSIVGQQHQPRNTYATHVTFSYQHGRNAIKFGAETRSLYFNEYQNANSSGTFNFTRGFTQGPVATQSSTTAGFGFASLLLGYPGAGTVLKVQAVSSEGLYYAGFLQDDIRVLSNFTINAGIRYEITKGTREKYNRIATFDPNATSPLATTLGISTLKGAVNWVGGSNPKDQLETNYMDFGPRIGFSYQPNRRMTIRGGYGLFFLPRSVASNGAGALETSVTTNMVTTLDGGLTPYNTLNNPYPSGILTPANDRSSLANVGSTMTIPSRGFKDPYAQLFSFGIQEELPAGIVLEAYYWGNKGTHMITSSNINQLPDKYLSLGSVLTNPVPNPFYGYITSGTLSAKNITQQQSLLPYPQYLDITQINETVGASNYHAATIKAEKRISKALTFLSSFTWQKSLDNLGTPYNTYHRDWEYSLSAFDVSRHDHNQRSCVYREREGRE